MRNYDRINALPPADIENKRAHIVGGGIAGLATAAFLATDAHMPPAHITVYESMSVVGGSMDAAGNHDDGYTSRGERELEPWMECLWYLCSKIPSLETPGLTVLDETHRANLDEPIESHFRLLENRGQRRDVSGPLMSAHDSKMLMRLIATPEDKLENLTVTDWFSDEFVTSTFWYCWSSMLAFRDYHSLIEVKRYLARFMMYTAGLTKLDGILHTKYNEYDSIIRPARIWLENLGVTFRTSTTIRDIDVVATGEEIVATGLLMGSTGDEHRVDLTRDDLVFFTNGSMTQNSTWGTTTTVAELNRDTLDRGVFTIWERLAALDARFGNPAAFISDVEKTNWTSFFTTFTGDRTFFDLIEAKTRDRAGTGGAMTIVDSSWKISFVLYGKYYPDQPDDVHVMWAYGQCSDVPGDYVKKPMRDCTGAEMLAELLYHCGCEDRIDSIVRKARVSSAAMPYITSQFMPRTTTDRPKVVPDGSVNLAFIGQYAELPGDVVFTVETSVRTAMMAVWELTGLQKPQIPMHEPWYDLRVILQSAKSTLDINHITLQTLPRLLAASPSPGELIELLRDLPAPLI